MTDKKDLFDLEPDKSLLTAFGWWEKRRWIFNLVMGLTGSVIFFLIPSVETLDILGVLVYGILANLCYCTGFLIEVVARYYFKNESDFTRKREFLYGAGLLFSVLVTALLAFGWSFVSAGHPS